jgi:hypothetical protein
MHRTERRSERGRVTVVLIASAVCAVLIEERVCQLDMQNLVSLKGQKLSKHSIYCSWNKRLD